MNYKLLAVDVDGTLLRRDGSIHPDDRSAIARLAASGVPTTIATGRLYSGTCDVARSLDLAGPIACVDGSHIVDLRDDSPLFYSAITGADAASLRDVLVRHRPAAFLFARDAIVHDAAGHPFAPYVRTWSPNIDLVDRVTEHPCWEHELGLMGIVALASEDVILAAFAELEALRDNTLRIVVFPVPHAGKVAMIVRAFAATKGTAVEWLARHHGCAPEDVVVVGDWLNDVPMFEIAGRSFAMAQAPQAVKDRATDELAADGITGGGVAEAIRRAFGV